MIKKISCFFIIIFLFCHISSVNASGNDDRNIDLRNDIIYHIGSYDKEAYLTILRYLDKGINYGASIGVRQINDELIYNIAFTIQNEEKTEIYFHDYFKGRFKADYSDILGVGSEEVQLEDVMDKEEYFKLSDMERIR